jgi:hypothetical protein
MSARERLAALDDMPATDLCMSAEASLGALVKVMNEETTLLRAGHYRQAGTLTAEKVKLAQDYVGFARSVQRQMERLRADAPEALERLLTGHERLATQMADNLKVIATARSVAKDLLTDVATSMGRNEGPKTYGRSGRMHEETMPVAAKGISVNRAL